MVAMALNISIALFLMSIAVLTVTMASAESSMFVSREREERSLFFRGRLCHGDSGPTKLAAGQWSAFNIGRNQWRGYVLQGVPSGVDCVCQTTCAFTPLNIDLFSHTNSNVVLNTAFDWDDSSMGPNSQESTTVSLDEGSPYNCYAYVYAQELAEGCFVRCKQENNR